MNGHDYSINARGINIVVFDYQSGLFEHRAEFDVHASSTPRSELASFLNTLEEGKILFMALKRRSILSADLALALQRIGVSAKYATYPTTAYYRPLAAVLYTGKERKSWETSLTADKGTVEMETKINIFHESKGTDACSEELGIRIGKIPNSRFYAKTTFSNGINYMPYQARLHTKLPGWCSVYHNPVSDYLQVDLGVPRVLSGIAIQGHGVAVYSDLYITKFKLEYSLHGQMWFMKKDPAGIIKEFPAIKKADRHETKVNWFERTLARWVRIVPTDRSKAVTCVRFELFGCSPEKPFFTNNMFESPSESIGQYNNGKLLLYNIASSSQTVKVGISTAAKQTSLAQYTDQLHFNRVNESVTFDNGTVLKDFAKVTKVRNDFKKLHSVVLVEYEVQETDYQVLEVGVGSRVCVLYLFLVTQMLMCVYWMPGGRHYYVHKCMGVCHWVKEILTLCGNTKSAVSNVGHILVFLISDWSVSIPWSRVTSYLNRMILAFFNSLMRSARVIPGPLEQNSHWRGGGSNGSN